MDIGALSFGVPALLIALTALPVIWWLLRVTPPAAKRIQFPPLRFLLDLNDREETPAHTPLWLLILRMIVAALIILALAEPVLNRQHLFEGENRRPLVIVIDDSWGAAHRWDARVEAMTSLLSEAEDAGVQVVLLPTAMADATVALEDAAAALGRARAMVPQPYGPDRAAALERLKQVVFETRPLVVWMSDGIDDGNALFFVDGLASIGDVETVVEASENASVALLAPDADAAGLIVQVRRAQTGVAVSGLVRALGENGRFLGETRYEFGDSETAAASRLDAPLELRNAIVRLELVDRVSAGGVQLLDDAWKRRPVGLVAGGDSSEAQPLLSDLYYLERALAPSAEIRKGAIRELIAQGLSVLVLADVGKLVGEDHDRVVKWIEDGGVLVRFAGPRLAAQNDDVLPVKLRAGDRALGGALSWEQPQALSPMPENGVFANLPAPADVRIERQVLAEPSIDLADRTWARLTDGTPLVTAAPRGKGWVVLFHVTANAEWSNLPLSGLYVDMMKRLIGLGHGVGPKPGTEGAAATATAAPTTLPPRETLDGFGRAGAPPPGAKPLRAGEAVTPGRDHPPGLYGTGAATVALNLFGKEAELKPLPASVAQVQGYDRQQAQELKPWLLGIAVLLALIDGFAALALRGLLPLPARWRTGAAVVLLAATLFAPRDARADDEFAMLAANTTRLAFVKSGHPDIDDLSMKGLVGLTEVLSLRTAVEAGEPMGVDIETDELAFFPLLYWPVPPDAQELSASALAKVDAYLKNGGTIVFDTRDQDLAGISGEGPGGVALRRLLARLDVPPLEPVPVEHVLTKAFYLLNDFPGRFVGGRVWVQTQGHNETGGGVNEALGDGVSPVIIGSNDWAAAWAQDEYGRPVVAIIPGGERQREMALRFGVNLVMYALTGNYKSDQVHVPALLERLGQ